jgi:hypothetical protein
LRRIGARIVKIYRVTFNVNMRHAKTAYIDIGIPESEEEAIAEQCQKMKIEPIALIVVALGKNAEGWPVGEIRHNWE